MNREAIKFIYYHVLIHNYRIKYLGNDRYKLMEYYPSGEKCWEAEYKNDKLCGKAISWYANGITCYEHKYQDGKIVI